MRALFKIVGRDFKLYAITNRKTNESLPHIDLDMLVVTASPARTALKISQLTDGGMPPTYDSMH